MVLSLLADSLVALGRISSFLTAEELGEPYRIDTAISNAIDVDGDFTWETAGKPDDVKKTTTPADEDPIRKAIRIKEEKKKAKEEAKGKKKGGLSTPTAARQSTEPLEAPVRAIAPAGRSAKMDVGEQHKFELGDCWET